MCPLHQCGDAEQLFDAAPLSGRQQWSVRGLHDPTALVREFEGHADDGRAAWGFSTIEDWPEWYVEAQGESVPIDFAASFVAPLLAGLRAPR